MGGGKDKVELVKRILVQFFRAIESALFKGKESIEWGSVEPAEFGDEKATASSALGLTSSSSSRSAFKVGFFCYFFVQNVQAGLFGIDGLNFYFYFYFEKNESQRR